MSMIGKNFLEKMDFLSTYFELTSPELEKVAGLFTKTLVPKGEIFLKTGQYCITMAFVHTGIARISALADGKEVTQWIASKGSFVTDLNSFTFGVPARWNMEAVVDTELFCISKQDYDKIVTFVPDWGRLERSFLVHCFTTMENRIFDFLSLTAEERYLSFFNQNKELLTQVPLQYIASMLGMTPETFSRVRKKLLS